MENNLVIEGILTCPPSETYAVRTLLMYSNFILKYQIFLEINWNNRDYYKDWCSSNFFFDYIKDLVDLGEIENCKRLQSIQVEKITLDNVNSIIELYL